MTGNQQQQQQQDDNDDNMTPDERLNWLRERGVMIETADDRRASGVQNAMQAAEALEHTGAHQDEFSYVLVPADTSRPLQECTLRKTAAGGDLLVQHLKAAFASASAGTSVDISLLQQEQPLLAASDAPLSVSDATLQQVAQQASVETFTLVHPMPSNGYTGIHIYLDEVGLLKRLPLNTRAAAYAQRAGFNPAPTFHGDVFLGRVQYTKSAAGGGAMLPHHVSFVLGLDTAMDAPWLQLAMAENLDYQMELNRATGKTGDERQPAVAGSDGKFKQEDDGFRWTQTPDELEVHVALPDADAQSKRVQVKFRPQSLQVWYQQEELLLVQLFERVDVDSCTWTMDRSTDNLPQLVVTMEKVEQALWPRIKD